MRYFTLFFLVLLLFTNCTKNCESLTDDGNTNPNDFPSACHGTYEGTASVKMRYFDPSGNFQQEKNFQFETQVFAGPPAQLKNAPVKEDNPFNLSIYSVNQVPEGAFSVVSGMGFTDPQDGKEVLLQYWNLEWDAKTGALSGELINTGIAQSLALNLLNVRDLFINFVTFNAMQVQTNLSGTIACNELEFTVKGKTTNEMVVFEIAVQAGK